MAKKREQVVGCKLSGGCGSGDDGGGTTTASNSRTSGWSAESWVLFGDIGLRHEIWSEVSK